MTELSTCRYRAFISYSHSDEAWARWLHRALETYRVPRHLVGSITPVGAIPERLAPVFRDRDELASSTDLGAELREALDQSAAQIVICSRAAAKSHWVNEEIRAFRRLGRADRIFCLIVDGEPFASRRSDGADEECFPPALLEPVCIDGDESREGAAEPIAADARPGKDGKGAARLKLIAGLLGVGFDSLRQRDLQRRHRRMMVVASLALVGMLAALSLAATAVLARNEAQRQAQTAQQTSSFLVSLFELTDPGEARGATVTAREILTTGAERVETELVGQPEVQAQLMTAIGRIHTSLGLHEDARALLDAALARRRQIDAISARELSDTLVALGDLETITADFERAEALYLEALDALGDAREEDIPELADAQAGLAEVYYQTGRYGEAEQVLREVLALRKRILPADHPDVADAMEELGLNQFDQGHPEVALEWLTESLFMRQRRLGEEPHPDLAENLNNLGFVLMAFERFEESEAYYLQSLVMTRRLLGENHPDAAMVAHNLGQLYRRKREPEKAERHYREALEVMRNQLGEAHPRVAMVLGEISLLEYGNGDSERGIATLREALAIQRTALGGEHPEVAASMSRLGRWLAETGAVEEGEALLRNALDLSTRILGADHPDVAIATLGLAEMLSDAGELDEALDVAKRADALAAAAFGEDHWITAWVTAIHGGVLLRMGRLRAAEPMLLDSHEQLGVSRGSYSRKTLAWLVELYDGSGEAGRAEQYRSELAALAE